LLALACLARAQEAPGVPEGGKGWALPDPRGAATPSWAKSDPQHLSQYLALADGMRKRSQWLEAAGLALVSRRDVPATARDADKLLKDVVPHLSAAQVACLQAWLGRSSQLEARYARAALEGGHAAEARVQALVTLSRDPSNKELQDLLKRTGAAPSADSIPLAPGAVQSVFRVSLLSPQTGDYEAYGRSLRAGLEIAAQEFNAHAATPVRLDIHETAGEGWLAAREGRAALDAGAGVLVGDVLTVPTLVLAGLANQTGVPLLSPSATDPMVGATGPLVFQTGAPLEAQARTLAGYAVRNDKRRIIAVPANLDSAFLGAFEAEAKQLGASVARVPASSGMRDFRAVANELKRVRADAVLLPLDPEQGELWVGGLMKQGVFLPYLATDALDPQGFHPETRRLLDGMVAVSTDYALPEQAFARIDSLARAAYGLDADRFVRRGYLTGQLITKTIAAGADSPASFAALVRRRAGRLGFVHYEDAEATLPILTVRRGQLVRVH
jgi:ABC-type branched-subunit amino acid transport system substrate-binding protein